MQPDDEIIAEGFRLLEKVQMPDVKQVKRTGYVDDFVTGFRVLAVAELSDLLSCLQELARAGPRRSFSGVIHADVGETFRRVRIDLKFLEQVYVSFGLQFLIS